MHVLALLQPTWLFLNADRPVISYICDPSRQNQTFVDNVNLLVISQKQRIFTSSLKFRFYQIQALKYLRNIIDTKNNRTINYLSKKSRIFMSTAYNNPATDLILTAFPGVAFIVDGINLIYA